MVHFESCSILSIVELNRSSSSGAHGQVRFSGLVSLDDGGIAVVDICIGENDLRSVKGDQYLRRIGSLPPNFGLVRGCIACVDSDVVCILGDEFYLPVRDLKVTEPVPWEKARYPIRACVTVTNGPIHVASVGRTGTWAVHLVGDVVGRLRVLLGGRLPGLLSRQDGRTLLNIHQPFVATFKASGDSLLVFVGSLGSIVVVWADRSGEICASRHSVRSDGRSLSAKDIVIHDGDENDSLLIVNCRDGFCTCVRLIHTKNDTETSLICEAARLTSAGHLSLVRDFQPKSLRSSTLRAMLRGIDAAAERRKAILLRTAAQSNALQSWNAAILFGLAWKQVLMSEKNSLIDVSCSICGYEFDEASCSRPSESMQWYGVSAKMEITLLNNFGVHMSSGWILRINVREGKLPERVAAGDLDFRQHDTPSFVRTATVPIGNLRHGTSVTYKVPVTLKSHAPIFVSVSLVFLGLDPGPELRGRASSERTREVQHTAPSSGTNRNLNQTLHSPTEKLLRIPLLRSRMLDVIDCASPCKDRDKMEDTSCQNLRTPRLSCFFDPSSAGRTGQFQSVISQLFLPLKPEVLWGLCRGESLSRVSPDSSSCAVVLEAITALGSPFACEFRPDVSETGTHVTIRAPRHVLPFVRAAIIRRALNELEHSLKGRSSPEENILQSPAAVSQMLHECDLSFTGLREAQAKIVQLNTWLCETEQSGWLGMLHNEQDLVTSRHAMSSLNAAYAKWRTAFAELFTLEGTRDV